jgi:hypothetical protein
MFIVMNLTLEAELRDFFLLGGYSCKVKMVYIVKIHENKVLFGLNLSFRVSHEVSSVVRFKI